MTGNNRIDRIWSHLDVEGKGRRDLRMVSPRLLVGAGGGMFVLFYHKWKIQKEETGARP